MIKKTCKLILKTHKTSRCHTPLKKASMMKRLMLVY